MRAAAAVAFAATVAACGAGLPLTRPAPGGPTQIACCAVAGAPVEVTYLGVAGWLIRRGGSAVLSAPLFSHPSLLRVGFDTIAPDTARIDGVLDSLGVELGDVSLILSGHGHYDHLFRGDRDRDMTEPPRVATEWLDGRSHAYLVDFLENERVVFRVYYQDAVAAEPMGMVPDSLLRPEDEAHRRVDLALLVPSTYAEVPADPKPLFLSDFDHFLDRLDRALRRVSDEPVGWHLPVAGARFILR